MDLETIEAYVVAIAPMITAIVSIIATVIVSVKKCKAIAEDSSKSIATATEALKAEQQATQSDIKELTNQIHNLIMDNAKLKEENEKLIAATKAKAEAIRNVKKGK